jgi:PKD repeat protein
MRKILILLFLLLWGESVYCQIIAGFTANDTVGCNTLIVQFTNTSSGNETLSFLWDFGNGTFSSLKDPQVVYNEAGSYTVSLIAYNQSFSDTLIKVNYIVLFKAPKITALHASPKVGCVPLETTLTGDIEMGEAPINEIVWDFGDGNSSSLMQPTIQYNSAGKYSISLFITDSNNCESNFSAKQFVVAIASPIINFSAENTISCLDTFTASFKNLSTASSPLSYYWDFGNGFTSTLANPKQLYKEFNAYSVKLIGTDAVGCTDSLTKPSYIQMQDLQASVLMPDRYLCKHENLAITNTTIGANKHNWIFGDNTTSTLMAPQKNYNDTGDFNIIYIASLNADCFDTLTFKVKVDPVTAKFESDKNYGCEFPFSVQYSDKSIDASSWHWLFGDKSQSNIQNPQVEYSVLPALALEHNLFLNDTLIVESEMQCKDTMVIDSSIHLYLPQVYFTPNDSSKYQTLLKGCVPIQANFKYESQSFSTNDPFVTLQWDFGDNTSSQQNNPIHNYKSEGEYKVS